MRFVSSLAFVFALVSATGCGRTWPTASGFVDPTFLRAGGVRTVAIVAPDLGVGVAADSDRAPDDVVATFHTAARASLEQVAALHGFQAVPEEEGAAEPDAILSLSGYGYAGKDGLSPGEVLGLVVAVVVTVGIIAAIAEGGHHHGGGPRLHGGGRFAHGGGWHHGGPSLHFGVIIPPGPVFDDVPSEGPSHAMLAMTLVDRQTGKVIWSASADYPVNPGTPEDVQKAIALLGQSLPRAR